MSFETELPTTIEKPKEPGIPKEILDMYVVPGYEESYTEHSLQRYRRRSAELERLDGALEAALKLENFDEIKEDLIPFLISRVKSAKQAVSLIRCGVVADSSSVRHEMVSHIEDQYIDQTDRYELCILCIASNDPIVRRFAADLVVYFGEPEKSQIIQTGLDTGDATVIRRIVSEIQCVSEKNKDLFRGRLLKIVESSKKSDGLFLSLASLIDEVEKSSRNDLREHLAERIRSIFETDNVELFFDAARNIEYADYSDWIDLIRLVIGSGDAKSMKELLAVINGLSEKDRLQMRRELAAGIRDDFEIDDAIAIRCFTESVSDIEKPMQAEHIRTRLDSGDLATMCAVVKMIPGIEECERGRLIRLGLESGQPLVMHLAASLIDRAEESVCGELIDLCFQLGDTPTIIIATKAISGVLENSERVKFIQVGLKSNDVPVMRASIDTIGSVDLISQEMLWTLARDRMGPAYVEGPLYRKTEDNFSRSDFKKNGGAATTLLGNFAGNDLKERVIVRHFEINRFEEWKHLYDDNVFWKENGFDYVPIEPIVSFDIRKDGQIDAFAGVLDLSLQEWKVRLGEWSEELDSDAERLMSILSLKGYDHGHVPSGRSYTHDGNFCLRFFRNEDGSIDYSKKPRIYLIDFDEARIARSSEEA